MVPSLRPHDRRSMSSRFHARTRALRTRRQKRAFTAIALTAALAGGLGLGQAWANAHHPSTEIDTPATTYPTQPGGLYP